MEMPKFETPEKKVEEPTAKDNEDAKDLVIDPSTGLVTERENLQNPNA